MNRHQRHRSAKSDPELSFGGRMMAALVSTLLSFPVVGLLWFLFNSRFAAFLDNPIPISYLFWSVIAFAVLSFSFPKFAPSVLGKFLDLLIDLIDFFRHFWYIGRD
ncbi:MAG: hypothetical protein LBB76_11285 [Azoarcus sp.]|nr:hypothetical protein [Azoarcus sp.]